MISSENHAEKHSLVAKVIKGRGGSKIRTLVHDDMCRFRPNVEKRHTNAHKNIQTWLIDKCTACEILHLLLLLAFCRSPLLLPPLSGCTERTTKTAVSSRSCRKRTRK